MRSRFREVISQFVSEITPEMEGLLKQWEGKYGKKEEAPAEKKEAAEETVSPEEEKREERFSEADTELQALRKRLPNSPLPTNALDLLHEVWDRPVADAVRAVKEARERNEILKYHAAIILHALVPDKVAKPEIFDIQIGESAKNMPGEMTVEQMADEEAGSEAAEAKSGRPVPGYPEGYVPREKRAVVEQSGDDAAKEERFAEARRELDAEGLSSKTLHAALEVLEKARTMPTDQAVPYVINAERNFDILEYHANVILHALIPERMPKPKEPGIPGVETAGPTAVAEGAPKKPEQKEKVVSKERNALDQQLKEGIDLRRDSYRSIRGESDGKKRIFDAGSEGVKAFFEQLDMLTRALRPKLTPYLMKKYNLTITSARETGIEPPEDIYVNIDDFVSMDFEAAQKLADKIVSTEPVAERKQEAGPAKAAPEAGREKPAEAAPKGAEVPPEKPATADQPGAAEKKAEKKEEPYGDGWPGNLYALREDNEQPGRKHEDAGTFAERARERVAETASRLAERLGVKNLADWTRITYSKPFIDWNTSRALKLKAKLDDRRSKIGELETNRQHLEDEFKTFSKEGEISGGALMGIEKDRSKVKKDIEKTRTKPIDYSQNWNIGTISGRDMKIAGTRCAAVSWTAFPERLAPFEEKLSDSESNEETIGNGDRSLSGSAHAEGSESRRA